MGRPTLVFDCSALPEADAGQIDALAHLMISLGRTDCELRLANAGAGLLELIAFAGLAGVLRVEPVRKAEEREDPGGVEEEGQLGDPTA
jgi:hypothetical protein